MSSDGKPKSATSGGSHSQDDRRVDASTPCCVGAQTFSGNPLAKPASPPASDAMLGPHAQFLITHGRGFVVLDMGDVKVPQLCWLTKAEVSRVGQLQFTEEGVKSAAKDRTLIPIFLGESEKGMLCFSISVLMSTSDDARDALKAHLKSNGMKLVSIRSVMGEMPAQDIAVAGNAIAMAGWHKANLFCSRCGAPTLPIALGAKRVCTTDTSHKTYPRTDPAVIMLVEDVAGSRVLLGRRSESSAGAFTALSGFIDCGESIEEAVRREVREEAGVKVGVVSILGSQPWPIGRAGANELMIGCFAKAVSDDITVDVNEMKEVRWCSREELRDAVADSRSRDNPFNGGNGSEDPTVLYIPPPFAIAHHLVRAWVDKAYGEECGCRL